MSSDEDEPTTPVLPKDSDRGSSVSSDLQDEYEELLRYAIVTPKIETLSSAQRNDQISQKKDDAWLQLIPDPEVETEDERHSSRSMKSSQASPLIVEPFAHLTTSYVDQAAGQSSSRVSVVSDTHSDRLQTPSVKSRSNSLDPHELDMTEMFISEENINKMENLLDTWSNNLKSNVLTELRKWRFAFMEKHKQELMKEKEKYEVQAATMKSELDSLKEMLHTYETSTQRKDEVIANLSQVLDKQKEKFEKMRAFTHWRLQHFEAKEEAHAFKLAEHHYNLQLKKKVWSGWHSLTQRHWKVKVEQACRSRAEEVCSRLSTEYEAKLAEHCEAIEKAQAEISRLRVERERYEESMKKAFMRGVCALNMEALSLFSTTEGRPDQAPVHEEHDSLLPQDEPGSATPTQLQPYLISSTRFSPVQFDHPGPSHSETDDMMGCRATTSQEEIPRPTAMVHGAFPLGGTASSHKQVSGHILTASQQKPLKTVTTRITGRATGGRAPRSSLQVMGVSPPMSSVIVERHHPVTQLTIGQATAAKFPRGHASSAGRGSSRAHTSTCHVHSIKVVD